MRKKFNAQNELEDGPALLLFKNGELEILDSELTVGQAMLLLNNAMAIVRNVKFYGVPTTPGDNNE